MLEEDVRKARRGQVPSQTYKDVHGSRIWDPNPRSHRFQTATHKRSPLFELTKPVYPNEAMAQVVNLEMEKVSYVLLRHRLVAM